ERHLGWRCNSLRCRPRRPLPRPCGSSPRTPLRRYLRMPLQLEIVSPERRAFTDEVDMVIVPGIDGQLGILPHHTRLISALGTGELRIKKGGTEQILFIS